ncbi:MAG TPA: hypothetical protein ENG73_08905 [Desulfobacterales bacterium]|nr:hypothetical protein [Desulfobacterales bacterium]
MKLMSIAGARPNFMKVASIAEAIRQHNDDTRSPRIDHVLVHTGQHYDEKLSRRFFNELGLPRPDINLEVGSASHAVQTAEIIRKRQARPIAPLLERKGRRENYTHDS